MTTMARDIDAAFRLVGEAIADGLRAPAWMTVTEWADSRRMFRPYPGAGVERFRTRDRPYALFVQNAVHEAGVVHVAVMAAEQMGKTEIALNILGQGVECEPGPVLVVYPTDTLAREAGKKRITPMFRAVPSLRARMLERKYASTSRMIMFEHMSLTYAGSEADNATETWPYRRILTDELDRCKPGTVEKVQGRTTVFSDRSRLVLSISTPEYEQQGIHREFMLGDRRRFWVPCPRCGRFHTREFDLVEWPGMHDEQPRSSMEILSGALLRCPQAECRAEIHAHHNEWQLLRGVWAPAGLTPQPPAAAWALAVQDDPTRWHAGWIRELRERELLTGQPAATIAGDGGPGSGGDRASFAIDGLLNPALPNPYGQLAKEFVDAGRRRTRHFVTRRLGRPYERGRVLEASSLRAACPPPGKGGFLSWQIPAEACLIVATADVQRHHVYHMTIAVSDLGRTVHVIGAGRVDRVVKDGLANLWPAIARDYQVVDLQTGETLGRRTALFVGVDAADASREVQTAAADRHFHGWAAAGGQAVGPVYPMRGLGGQSASRTTTARKLIADLPFTADSRPRRVEQVQFSSDVFSQEVQDFVDTVRPAEAAMARSPLSLRLPFDAPDDLLEHLTSERLVETFKRGRQKSEWQVVGGKENHWRDCLKMGLALAAHYGLHKLKPYRYTPPPRPAAGPAAPSPRRERQGWMSKMTGE